MGLLRNFRSRRDEKLVQKARRELLSKRNFDEVNRQLIEDNYEPIDCWSDGSKPT